MTSLWIFFIILAILGIVTFVYALRSLGPMDAAEKQILELADRLETEDGSPAQPATLSAGEDEHLRE